MLQALLHGKLSRDQENAEDVLTSNVFGLLSYVSPQGGLVPLLAQSRDSDDSRPLEWLTNAPDCVVKNLDFWPLWQEQGRKRCEPDVVVQLQFGNRRDLLVLIEAKFRSAKSSLADESDERPNDQLAREWEYLAAC